MRILITRPSSSYYMEVDTANGNWQYILFSTPLVNTIGIQMYYDHYDLGRLFAQHVNHSY